MRGPLYRTHRYIYSVQREPWRAFPGLPSPELNLRLNQFLHVRLAPLWMAPGAPVPQRPVGLTGAASAANPWAPKVYAW